jgi:hypothetical protein
MKGEMHREETKPRLEIEEHLILYNKIPKSTIVPRDLISITKIIIQISKLSLRGGSA